MKKILIVPMLMMIIAFSGCTYDTEYLYESVPEDYLFVEIVEVIAIGYDDIKDNDIREWFIETNSTIYPIVDLYKGLIEEMLIGDVLEITWTADDYDQPKASIIKWIVKIREL